MVRIIMRNIEQGCHHIKYLAWLVPQFAPRVAQFAQFLFLLSTAAGRFFFALAAQRHCRYLIVM
jgi:hypothetical protein